MIKGSTKVGEIFLCGPETEGKLDVLSQFLGKAITGLGGGCKKMYVIEEGDSFVAIQPRQQEPVMRPGTEEERPSGRKYQALSHQKFGMTPFDQQQNTHNTHLQNPLAHVDQKIEERESLRHSTHRSQRSDRAAGNVLGGAGGAIAGSNAGGSGPGQAGAGQMQQPNQMQQTASDRFGQTDYNMSENHDRPAFQKASKQYNIDGDMDGNQEEQRFHDQQQQEILHQQQMQQNEDEPQKMFSFENEQKNTQNPEGQRQQLQTQQNLMHDAAQRTQNAEKMGHLQQICCGRDHTLNLTRDGDVFSYGSGTFSAAGHGGSKEALSPMILKPLRDKRVIKIACGESHSLILTDKADVYAWGRGFEGQLGLSKSIEVASTPQYIKAFYGSPVQSIEAGAYFSLAITRDGNLYGWGEAKMGQLGLGKQREVRIPQRIPIIEEGSKQEYRVVSCSAGFGHTACLTESGDLYTWGFNIYGQLGLGDKKTRWYPEKVSRDISGHNLARQIKVKCSNYAAFSIDEYGHPYSWGKGHVGHTGNCILDLPKMIETNTDNRIFTDMYANDDSILFYAPIRVYNISPSCGPSKGNTTISITGTGFVNSEKLRVRFTYGDLSQEVHCIFDEESQRLICRTPKFEEFDGEKHPSVQLPCDCYLSVTMDGINYSECEMPFKIYSNEINLTSLNPKSGSVKGGSEVTLYIDLDEVTASSIQNLTVGFQPRKKAPPAQGQSSNMEVNKPSRQSLNESSQRGSQANITAGFDDYQRQNPAGEFGSELANFTCSEGKYEDGKIICKVPQLSPGQYDPDGNLQYNVDVALNGQQFTGKPLIFRYYDIRLERIEPPFAQSEGGASIDIFGKGIYDSAIKRVKFACNRGEREVTADWDRKRKCLKCIVPPLTWLWGGEEVPPETLAEVMAEPIKVYLTFNNQEWIPGPDFKYHDHQVVRIAYAHTFMGETAEPEQREVEWQAEQPEEELPEDITDEDIQKREEEKQKIAEQETEESTTAPKRKGYRLFIHGSRFLKADAIIAKFTWEEKVSRTSECLFKNQGMLATQIPDMGAEVPEGEHMLAVEVSLNGQQFSSQNVQFLYKSVDPNLTEEDLKKMDEEDAKGAKKPAGKKK